MPHGAVMAIALAACSFGTSGPPDGYRPDVAAPPDCTTSRTAPVLDTVGAGLFGVAGIAYIAAPCGEGDHGGTDQTCEAVTSLIGVVLLVPAAIYTIAAISGYGKTGRCRDAMRAHEEHRARPRPGGPPGQAARMRSSLPSSGWR